MEPPFKKIKTGETTDGDVLTHGDKLSIVLPDVDPLSNYIATLPAEIQELIFLRLSYDRLFEFVERNTKLIDAKDLFHRIHRAGGIIAGGIILEAVRGNLDKHLETSNNFRLWCSSSAVTVLKRDVDIWVSEKDFDNVLDIFRMNSPTFGRLLPALHGQSFLEPNSSRTSTLAALLHYPDKHDVEIETTTTYMVGLLVFQIHRVCIEETMTWSAVASKFDIAQLTWFGLNSTCTSLEWKIRPKILSSRLGISSIGAGVIWSNLANEGYRKLCSKIADTIAPVLEYFESNQHFLSTLSTQEIKKSSRESKRDRKWLKQAVSGSTSRNHLLRRLCSISPYRVEKYSNYGWHFWDSSKCKIDPDDLIFEKKTNNMRCAEEIPGQVIDSYLETICTLASSAWRRQDLWSGTEL